MSSRARVAVTLVCVATLASAGCLGFLTGSEPLRFDANETVVSDGALAETEYSEASNRTISQTINVSLAGQTRRVDITSHLYTYNRSIPASALADGANATAANASLDNATAANVSAQFAVLSTPGASVGGRNVNPLASLSPAELVRRFLGTGQSADFEFQGNRTVQSLGAQRTVSTYRTGGGANGTAVVFHVMNIEYEGDVIVAIAGHPASVEERDRIDTLLAGLEQPES